MKEYLDRSMSFGEYRALIERLVKTGRTTGPNQNEALVHFTRLNLHRMNRLERILELKDEVSRQVAEVLQDQVWLIITEAWCGDAAQNIPIIEKIAAKNAIIETRYILRDENPELIDRFLTYEARSIPKLIAIDKGSCEVLWTWGARPQAAQKVYFELRNSGIERSEIMEQLQRWYNQDKGVSVQQEIGSLVRGSGEAKTAGAGI